MLKPFIKRLVPSRVITRYERELQKETHINRALTLFTRPTTYVEIGVRDGPCIKRITADLKLAVDPMPVNRELIERDGTQVFQLPSDGFFEIEAERVFMNRRISVALADGLHEFRQTLRDVLNLERYMKPGGLVFVHDCNPPTRRHAEDMNGPWNGDVWKIAVYLERFRPDLEFFTLDCDWGLGVIAGFSDAPPAVRERDVEEVARLDYEVLELNRKSILKLKSPLIMAPYIARQRLARRDRR